MKNKFKFEPKTVIIISAIIGLVMITSAYYEFSESKKEIYSVLSEQSSSLIQIIALSSINTLNSSREIEILIAERLLNNAMLIKRLDSLNVLTRPQLISIGNENDLFRINIFDKNGNRILSNFTSNSIHQNENVNRFEELQPILSGKTDKLIIGLKDAFHAKGERFSVAVARAFNRGAIVINLNAKDFLNFRKKIGIGKIIRDIGNNRGIEYIALQDTDGIISASSSVTSLSAIYSDEFLRNALNSDSIFMRTTKFNGKNVFEVIKRLMVDNQFIGLYRIGLSLKEVKSVEIKMYGRIILVSILLAIISVIILSIIFTSQNLRTVSREFNKFKTFAGTILHNMGEAVIVVNKNYEITLFNKAAEELFETKSSEVINNSLNQILAGRLKFIYNEIISINFFSKETQKTIEINEKEKHLSFNITKTLSQSNEIENYTIVINDLTNQKNIEEQSKRQEKLSAMGELASGVAHEIRNPINAIGMIAQRLLKEFSPKNDEDEYYSITSVLKDEVARINNIISQFLNYAKPVEIQKRKIDSKKYFNDIFQLFVDQTKSKKITLKKPSEESFEINIDPELLKQALMNIIQNAIDATDKEGFVSIKYFCENNFFFIIIEDNGIGISEEQKKKIFDLYFTTKKDGNGLGLSIAQKIISQHNGLIEVESKINFGTKFIIKLPIT
jgi:PAS domain S-box-containing protein